MKYAWHHSRSRDRDSKQLEGLFVYGSFEDLFDPASDIADSSERLVEESFDGLGSRYWNVY